MLNLKYIGSEEFYNVSFKLNGIHLVTITGDFPVKKTGFNLYLPGKKDILGDYSDFITVYQEVDGGVVFSNDGSVYVEPEIIEPEPPTVEELKTAKINSFSNECSTFIEAGVDVQIGDSIEHFSYTEEDQVNLKEIFDLAIQTNVPMYYHADGKGCKLYSVEELIAIYTTATTNKMHHITYFNQIRMYIESLETSEEVNGVEYGQELTGEFLQTYNESMAQAQLVLEALLTKRASALTEE